MALAMVHAQTMAPPNYSPRPYGSPKRPPPTPEGSQKVQQQPLRVNRATRPPPHQGRPETPRGRPQQRNPGQSSKRPDNRYVIPHKRASARTRSPTKDASEAHKQQQREERSAIQSVMEGGAGIMPDESKRFFMSPQQPRDSCPAGLEYLARLDHLFVEPKRFVPEDFVPEDETTVRNVVKNIQGKIIYILTERLQHNRIDMELWDFLNFEVMHLTRRSNACTTCICFMWCCCEPKLEVCSPPGEKIGIVIQHCNIVGQPSFEIQNRNGRGLFMIKPEKKREFNIRSYEDKKEFGKISAQWPSLKGEIYTKEDTFGVEFLKDAVETEKALVLAASIFINYIYYEEHMAAQAAEKQAQAAEKQLSKKEKEKKK